MRALGPIANWKRCKTSARCWRELRYRDVEADIAGIAEHSGRSERLLDTLLQALEDAVLITDADGQVQQLNTAARNWQRDGVDLGQHAALNGALNGESVSSTPALVVSAGGEQWQRVSAVPLRDARQRQAGALLLGRDITAQIQAEQRADATAAELAHYFDGAPCGYCTLDPQGLMVRVNQRLAGWLQRTPATLVGHTKLINCADLRATHVRALARLHQIGTLDAIECALIRADGSAFPVQLSATAVVNDRAEWVASRITLLDFSAVKAVELQRHDLARMDLLTGLWNRLGFFEQLDTLRQHARQQKVAWLLLLATVDALKHTNEQLGLLAGDELITAAAHALRAALGADAVIARLGGDEFVAAKLLPDGSETINWHGADQALFSVGEMVLNADNVQPIGQLLAAFDGLMFRRRLGA